MKEPEQLVPRNVEIATMRIHFAGRRGCDREHLTSNNQRRSTHRNAGHAMISA